MADQGPLLVGGQIRDHLRHPDAFRMERRRRPQEVGTHTLGGSEEEQDRADAEAGRPDLLRRERPRVGVGERPHGERRGGVNAHQREHIGQHHDAGPKPADGCFLTQPGGELDDPRNGEVGVVIAAAPALGRLPFADCRLAQLGQFVTEGVPAAQLAISDDADGDDAESQQQALHRIDIGHGPKTARRHIDEHHERQQPHAEFDMHQIVGQSVEQQARSAQLQAQVRDRKQQCDDHDQDADAVTLEIGGEHFTRRDETETLAEHPLAFQEHHAREWNGDRVERRVSVLETVTVDQTRVPHEGPTRKRCRRGSQHEDPHRELTARDEIIAGGFRHPRAFDAPEYAVGPIQRDEHEQPNYFR